MKKFSILAMVLAFTMMLSITSFAAVEFRLAEDAVVPEGTTVTPAADSIAVETAATAGNYYGILLVEGNALPTVDNAILYINQATAADVKQAFEVLPNMTDLEDGDILTLYISSNVAGASLISVPMVYADEKVVVPEEPEITVLLGDVTGDECVDMMDGYYILLYDVGLTDTILEEGCPQFWNDEDPAYANARGDVTADECVDMMDGYYILLYDVGLYDTILEEGCPKFWED